MTRAKIAALALALTLSSAPSFAADFFLLDQTKVGRSNNLFWLDIGVDTLNHTDSNAFGLGLKTSEHGPMAMLQIGASALGQTGWFLSASASVAGGSTEYVGFDASLNPDTGETDEGLFTIATQLGWNISPFESVTFIPYIEGNYHYWNRKTEGDLEYTHFAVLGGAKLQFAPTKPTVLSLYGAYGKVLSPSVESNTTTYKPAEENIYHIGAKFAYTPTSSPRYEAFIATEYSAFEYGRGTAGYFADTTMRHLTTRVGLGYHFGLPNNPQIRARR